MRLTARNLLTLSAMLAVSILVGCDSGPTAPLEQSGGDSAAASTKSGGGDASTANPSAEELEAMNEMLGRSPGESDGAAAALPPGHPPIDAMPQSGAAPAPSAPMGGATGGAGLSYDAPDTWKQVPPGSPMRSDQYVLPAADEDAEDGELAVFSMGVGGGVMANVDRWRKQFAAPDGSPVGDDAFHHEVREVNGLKVTVVDVAGRFQPTSMTFGGAAPDPKDDYRMLAAIVEMPGGAWFFKGTGPQTTMSAHEDAFNALIESFKRE